MTFKHALPVLLLLALPASADPDPTTQLAQLLHSAAQSQNPTLAFLRGAGGMPDAELDRAQVLRAMRAANLPNNDALRSVLGNTSRIRKKGDRIELWRDSESELTFTSNGKAAGKVKLGKHVRVRLRLGKEPKIDKIKGIEVAKAGGSFYDLWNVRFYSKNGRQYAAVTAGAFIFSDTVHVDLTPEPKPEPKPEPESTPTQGLVQAVQAAGS